MDEKAAERKRKKAEAQRAKGSNVEQATDEKNKKPNEKPKEKKAY